MAPTKSKNPLTGYVSLIGGLIPIVGVLLGVVVYVINLNSTISNNAEKLKVITSQLENPAVQDFLEPNQFGETEFSNRLNGFEYALWEDLLPRIEAIQEQIILIEIALKDLDESRVGTNHYLYGMSATDGGVQQSLQSMKTHLSLLQQEVESIHGDHMYFVDVLNEIEDEFDIRLSKPPDVYGGYDYR